MIDTLIIQVTKQCNLTCDYCIPQSNPTNNILNIKSLEKIAELFVENLGHRNGYVTYTGNGEPLIQPKLMFYLFDYMTQKNSKIKLRLITNGTLLSKEIAARLSEYKNLHVVISCDGPMEQHDSNRPQKNGIGSYQKMIEGVKALTDRDVSVELRAVVTDKTINNLDSVLEHNSEFGSYPCKVRPIGVGLRGNTTSVSDKELYSKKFIEYLEGLPDLCTDDKLIPADIVSWIARYNNDQVVERYCNAGYSSVCIDEKGDLYPCELYQEEKYLLGNIENINHKEWNELIKHPAMIKVREHNPRKSNLCDLCDSKSLCSGGCPALNSSIYTEDATHPLCEHYKKLHSYLLSRGVIE